MVTDEQANPSDEAFELMLERVVDRLRTLGESRLLRHDPATGLSLAEQVHRLAVEWAAHVHGQDGPVPPRLAPLASGDQLAVLGAEVLAAWREGRLDASRQEAIVAGLDAVRRQA